MPLLLPLAANESDPVVIAIAAVMIAIFIGIVVGLLFFVRWYENAMAEKLRGYYEDLKVHQHPQRGDVKLDFATYHGIVAWFTQTGHNAWLPPDDARILLSRLFWFNCSWGLMSAGCLFSVPLSIINYFSELRSIAKQEMAGGAQPVTVPLPAPPGQPWTQTVEWATPPRAPSDGVDDATARG